MIINFLNRKKIISKYIYFLITKHEISTGCQLFGKPHNFNNIVQM